ncbi:serine hydrolase domain-containing protein [Janthinobacterium svalbardensis]|uniref:serine hydrolase domain-containing protein n=1 Tax=Janthinobacterium svalbardensis TaxID=368607 RepID=UPI002FCDB25B
MRTSPNRPACARQNSADEDEQSPGNEDKLDAAPCGIYRYNSLGAYIAGRVVENASGADLEDFAAKVLFAPLGITRWSWGRDVAHHPKGQGNLSLPARDTEKIGQMALNDGVFEERRVIDAAWIKAALAPRVAIGAVDRHADSYGYFWYAKTQNIGGRKIAVYFASGNGGNKIYVIPARRMVVSIASSAYGKGYGQRRSEDILKAIVKADATQM